MELTEFLLARIAEDESNGTDLVGVARKDWHARWVAECEAKRRIVGLHHREIWHQPASTINDPKTGRPFVEESHHLGGCTICAGDSSHADWPCDTLKALTAVYADHPDCDPGWKS